MTVVCFAGRAKIVRIDVDAEPELASTFQVDSIPTLAFIVDGNLAKRAAGLVSEEKLRQALNQLAGATPSSAHRES